MNTKHSWLAPLVFGVCVCAPFAAACTNDASGDPTDTTTSALGVTKPIGSAPIAGGNPGGSGGGYAPIPVYPATVLGAGTTSDTVNLGWQEHGGNARTEVYRQLYDLAGNTNGGAVLIRTYQNLPAGSMTLTDMNLTTVGATTALTAPGAAPALSVPGGATLPPAILPDHQIGYTVVEYALGYTDCESVQGSSTCARTSVMAYTRDSGGYGAGRAQLRMKVASTTAHVGALHVQAELSPWNITWLDSTNANFTAGSNTTYDLLTDFIDARSDIQYIDLWTPDADGVCISELQLKIDNTTTFHQSFPTCQWVKNGSHLSVPFAALRSSSEWQNYNPFVFPPTALTFVGFDNAGLISYLDAAVGDGLKNPMPTPVAGFDAQLGAATTISRTDPNHLHVTQHLINIHAIYKNTDYGTMNANPSYDLVIHHADATCAGWCLKVENVSAGGSYSDGLTEWILDLITLGVRNIIEHKVNTKLADALSRVTNLADPQGLGYCFVPTTTGTDNPGPTFPTFADDGVTKPFDTGSLTICWVSHP